MPALKLSGKELLEDTIKKPTVYFDLIKKVNPIFYVIWVGNNPASEIYIRNKKKAFDKTDIKCEVIHLSEDSTVETVESVINAVQGVYGIRGVMVQLPLPEHLKEYTGRILGNIKRQNDSDGLVCGNIPCTADGVLMLLKKYNIDTDGKDITIIGRSIEVGRSLARLLSSNLYNATVTLCHSHTKNLEEKIKNADIVISAVGKPKFINASMIKEGAVCIDVGINKITEDDGSVHTVGDFLIDDALINKASAYTPTPGGTGPATIAALIKHVKDNSGESDCSPAWLKFVEKIK